MQNYYGIPDENASLEKSEIAILSIPYDGTSTWIKGADKGPEAIYEASCAVELYDIETDSEVYLKGIYTAPPVLESSSPDAMVEAVYDEAKKYLNLNKFLVSLGGEHSVSIGLFKAFSEKFDNLTILQFDAHSDMRHEYEGSKFNHACALARGSEFCNVVHVGIRSMDVSEKSYINKENIFFAEQIHKREIYIEDIVSRLTENVYITIDLDVFDPAYLPATGTPEPGGLSWYEVLYAIQEVNKTKNIVGFDVVELCPMETEKASNFFAAKLVYKILSIKFSKNN